MKGRAQNKQENLEENNGRRGANVKSYYNVPDMISQDSVYMKQ